MAACGRVVLENEIDGSEPLICDESVINVAPLCFPREEFPSLFPSQTYKQRPISDLHEFEKKKSKYTFVRKTAQNLNFICSEYIFLSV